ncbi:ATP-binding cassette domain-containing protein [Sphingomonas sp. BAUL-RG-20F-R05-02]|uniref:ATP-binding cassette domain-containing protein n=1 Tax=Sphingomonas sp. BAUL-RG-20F-R05-02 TaxID=2914830 RepID=UPI001F58F2FA|nr:ATP-binding cassette domain-containing protein [Sphingomonas sp. BAUL-RG-20F-R05-02]
MAFDVRLRKRLGDAQIAVTLEADEGATVLFGPSGAGKTSVLNMIAGLLPPDEGHIRVGDRTLYESATGVNVPPERRSVGYVFQEARLFPHMRVRDNLRYGVRGAAPDLGGIDFLGIAHLLDRWPRTLSGGEAQRVSIGRALLSAPEFLLLDEPLSSLDRARRDEILIAIEHVRDVLGLPILMVTHDMGEAERIATRIVAL